MKGRELREMDQSKSSVPATEVYGGHKDLVTSYSIELRQRKANDVLGIATVVMLFCIVVNEAYHSDILLFVNSGCVLVKLVFLFNYYADEFTRRKLRDPLWSKLSLFTSPLAPAFFSEFTIILLHCPPFLPRVDSSFRKLNILSFMRVYIFLRLFRDRSFTSSNGGRLVGQLSRTELDITFIIKTTLYTNPFPLALTSLTFSFLIMSFCMYVAESDQLSVADAFWLTGVTFTTVGYGNIVPKTDLGRILAMLSAILGIMFTALITAVILRSLTISKTQKQMVLFMMECGQSLKIKDCSARVVGQCVRIAVLQKQNRIATLSKEFRVLDSLCRRNRSLRRREGMMEIDVLEMLIADPRYVLSQNTGLQQLCRKPADSVNVLQQSQSLHAGSLRRNQPMGSPRADTESEGRVNERIKCMEVVLAGVNSRIDTIENTLNSIISEIRGLTE
eukprot:TRINITY_DN14199_c0_g2_i2.p1 TRINITY_DN14199_c0_g2~~TRINITY_DN14199_c0_g2_i2.p1  ORF type:complete len:447 (+),score=44.36 TRINITY_DN14199_c0_g2_i2:40-1380(+)